MATGERSRWGGVSLAIAAVLVAALAVGIGRILVGGGDPSLRRPVPAEREEAPAAAAPRRVAAEPPKSPGDAHAPAHRIADQGRLRVARDDLREGEVLALGLELPAQLRGDGPRRVHVVDAVSGRVLETNALPVGSGAGGLRLEIDPEWLVPGTYMIQVEVVGAGPLPLRRYVLEVD